MPLHRLMPHNDPWHLRCICPILACIGLTFDNISISLPFAGYFSLWRFGPIVFTYSIWPFRRFMNMSRLFAIRFSDFNTSPTHLLEIKVCFTASIATISMLCHVLTTNICTLMPRSHGNKFVACFATINLFHAWYIVFTGSSRALSSIQLHMSKMTLTWAVLWLFFSLGPPPKELSARAWAFWILTSKLWFSISQRFRGYKTHLPMLFNLIAFSSYHFSILFYLGISVTKTL